VTSEVGARCQDKNVSCWRRAVIQTRWTGHKSPTNTATNPISVDQPYAGPAASCCSINGTHSIKINILFRDEFLGSLNWWNPGEMEMSWFHFSCLYRSRNLGLDDANIKYSERGQCPLDALSAKRCAALESYRSIVLAAGAKTRALEPPAPPSSLLYYIKGVF
jgi:hypothetical protein